MAFQIRSFADIVAGEIAHMRGVTDKITDFQPGSVARTLVEAPASEIEELYMQMLLGLRDAIPVATFKSFGFDPLPASMAHGFVSMSLTPAPTVASSVPLGTTFRTADGRSYVSTAAVAWPAGTSMVRVPVRSTVAGTIGNVPAGAITITTLTGTASYVISNAAITNGRDPETDREREARFAEFIRSLSRGTLAACRYALSTVHILDENGNVDEYVTRIGLLEDYGNVRYWIYSNKGIASAELVSKANNVINGYTANDGTVVPGFRAAGVRIDVLAMVERAVPMSIQVGMFPGDELTTAVRQAITDQYATSIRAIAPSETVFLKSIVEDMLAVDGVRTIVPGGTENVACGPGEALVPGTLTITSL